VSTAAETTAAVIDEMTQGWVTKQIQEVADVNPRIDKKAIPDDLEVSFVPMPAVEAESGQIDVSEVKVAKQVKKGFTAFLEGDVLFAKITPCMENGKMAIAPALINDYGFGSTEFHVLRPGDDIDAKYLYYYVSSKSFRGEAERFMTGAVGQKRVSTTYIKEASIPVAPLDDQRRIVAEIEKQFSRLDEAVASLKRVKANLKRYKAAVLKAAVEAKLTEEWREQSSDSESIVQLLGDICRTMSGGTPSRRNAEYFRGNIPWVKSGELPDGIVECIEESITQEAVDNSGAKIFPAGTLLIALYGATVGKLGILPCAAATNQAVCALFPREEIEKDYLFWFLMHARSELLHSAIGGAQTNISQGILRALKIVVPPIKVQKAIVLELEKQWSLVDETELTLAKQLEKAARMRSSILSAAFSGRLAAW